MPPPGQRMLVVMLHGCTQDADDIAAGTRLNEAAARDAFIALYVEQPESAHPRKCWNWYVPEEIRRGAGEASIIAELTMKVAHDEGVDPKRVFIAGMSAGAGMAANLVAAYPELFAAAAFHSGVPALSATDVPSALAMMSKGPADADALGAAAHAAMGLRARVVPVIVIHGAADPAVSVLNLRGIVRQWVVANALAAGAAPPRAVALPAPDARMRGERYALGDGRVLADAWRVEGLAHAWSGGSSAGTYTDPTAPDVTSLMLTFFRAHAGP
jgi:poly(hydroxyalkanoate) depolymerase family esterase